MADSALIDDLEKQFAENPRRVFARLANEYRKAGDAERAIEICRHHVPQQPTYISGHIVLGQALFDTGQFDEARSAFETALELDPENLIALRQLGDIARETGDRERARTWYRRLLEVDPQNDEVAEQLQALDEVSDTTTPAAATDAAGTAREPEQEQVHWGDIHPDDVPPLPQDGSADQPDDVPPLPFLSLEPEPEAAAADAGSRSESTTPADAEIVLDTSALAAPLPAEAEEASPAVDAAPATAFDPTTLDAIEIASVDEAPAATPDAPAPPVADGEERASDSDTGAAPSEDESGEAAPPDAFVTETMAELYVRQGFAQQALDIYRQLARQSPDVQRFHDAVAELEQTVATAEPRGFPGEADEPLGSETRVGPSIREFLNAIGARRAAVRAADAMPAADAGGEVEDDAAARDDTPVHDASTSVDAPAAVQAPVPEPSAPSPAAELFSGQAVAQLDDDAAGTLAEGFSGGFESNDDGQGEPARPAADELSLDAVFGETSRNEAQSTDGKSVSFDQFFAGDGPGGDSELPADGGSPPSQNGANEASDLELFHAWLEGLKK